MILATQGSQPWACTPVAVISHRPFVIYYTEYSRKKEYLLLSSGYRSTSIDVKCSNLIVGDLQRRADDTPACIKARWRLYRGSLDDHPSMPQQAAGTLT
jgi:hypothetical protein